MILVNGRMWPRVNIDLSERREGAAMRRDNHG